MSYDWMSDCEEASGGPEREGGHGTCDFCEKEEVLLGFGEFGDECEPCQADRCDFEAEDRAVRHAEGGNGYSGNWNGYEAPSHADDWS